ncbi:MAG: protoheme IX farnesyltransferase [Bacillati bacterium ANGP1]|uniref:Protoheme IX farnesyltransferase n=1 Tax=Candidatus Segetimicrobium genomatis TaxID=2569760 RepID=A0A537KSN6_9BACT|nr:MAG: protoheme IX farnesyltransferase [Terrabacteria group bacterium ANGP1]
MKAFGRLASAAVVATFVLIILGGLVRATGAGLACPDWPLCHGRLIPPLDPLVLTEWSHRFVASIVGILTLAVAVAAWRLRKVGQLGLVGLSNLALVLVIVQIGLGGLTVRHELTAWLVVAHLGTAMAFFATLIILTVTTMTGPAAPRRHDPFRTLAFLTVVATFGLVLIGGYVSASGAGLACPDWPLCYGQLLPSLTGGVGAHLLHRFAAAIAGALIVVTAAAAYRTQARRPQLQAASAIAVGLLILQIILGALNIEYRLADAVTTAHLATAAALFATLVVLALLASRLPESEAYQPEAAGQPGRSRVQRVMDYVALTKPRIIVLLLVTAFASMLIAAPGRISPSGRVSPPYALAFAVLLGTVAFVEMAVLVNLLAALLSLAALLFYVFVYTVWLKRSTPQNIVIGGAAGAVPPLVGWAAATGHLSLTAILLFVIVFLWTPPHFWALALFRRDDYALAHVPMLPVVAGETETRRQIVIYTVVLVLVTFLLYPVARLGPVYLLSAGFLGAAFVMLAVRLQRQQTTAAAVRVFGYSIFYLGLLFAAMVADRLLQA